MAVMNVYSILDRAAEEYGPPFIAKNHEVAKRNFVNLLNEVPDHVQCDYILCHIGTFDTEEGKIESTVRVDVVPVVAEDFK